MPGQTALARVAAGQSVSATTAKQAAETAMDKLRSMKSKVQAATASASRTGLTALHMVETGAATYVTSIAEGYWGPEKQRIGGKLDWRWPLGALLAGWGLADAVTGKSTGGSHGLAVGQGVLMSKIASAGVETGKAVREKKDKDARGGGAAGGGGQPGVHGDEGEGGRTRDIRATDMTPSLSDPPRAARGGAFASA